jgi:hypothetical protein
VKIIVRPGDRTAWSAYDGTAPLGEGSWDEWDVAAGLDALIRMVHRAGRLATVSVGRPCGTFLSRVAARSVDRILDVYEAVEVDWE